MPLFPGQQQTRLQRASITSTVPITSADYVPAPSSGNSASELASLIDNRQSGSITQTPQYQQSSKTFTANNDKSNSYSLGRNAASVLSPRANHSIMRSVSTDSDAILPITHNNGKNNISDQAPQKPRRATLMRAAESGKGSLLPMIGAIPISRFRQQPQLPQRSNRKAPRRSNSSGPSSSAGLPKTRQDLGDSNAQTNLRLRRVNASSDDEFDSGRRVRRDGSNQNDAYFSRRSRQSSAMSVSSTGSVGATHNGSMWGNGLLCQHQLIKISRMKLGHLLQVVIVLAVIALVYESHHKALFATQQLIQFKDEESLLLLHLQKIEQQSIQLHENFKRLAKTGGDNSGGNPNPGDKRVGEKEVDFDLIHKQTEQLKHMEEELSHEVETLQKRIQQSARNHIIQEFGEGPVQVVLELDFGDATLNAESHQISILLWHDTPHAAWTWLEQIGNNVWDGAEFKWQQSQIIDAVPPKDRVNPERDGKTEFVEHSQGEHKRWTVGVREVPNNDGSGHSSMSMYINLQDNSRLHKHETCVGHVIDGFDTLHKLLEQSKPNGNTDESDNSPSPTPISIRKAIAEHYVTKKEGMGK